MVAPGYVQTPLASKQTGENAPWRQADPVKRQLYQAGGSKSCSQHMMAI